MGRRKCLIEGRQWFLVDAAHLEPVVTAGKYWSGGASSWLLGDLSVSFLLSWPLGLPALLEGFVRTMTEGYTAGGASRGEAKLINCRFASPEKNLGVM